MTDEMPVYPAGTPIRDVNVFDRSTKVVFKCVDHPQWVWMSKDPYVSRWFPADKATDEACISGAEAACSHSLKTPGQYVLARDYHPTRNG